jgi:hypothetical protein
MVSPQGHALIIEDEMIIALEVEGLLSDLGFTSFDVADSPAQAVAAALARRPDLVTADYRIIDGTGLEAVAGIVRAIGACAGDLRDRKPRHGRGQERRPGGRQAHRAPGAGRGLPAGARRLTVAAATAGRLGRCRRRLDRRW